MIELRQATRPASFTIDLLKKTSIKVNPHYMFTRAYRIAQNKNGDGLPEEANYYLIETPFLG